MAKKKTHNPVLLIRLAWNPKGWAAGVRHGTGEGGWPAKHGWAGEDWNFAVEQAMSGYVYGFSQGAPGAEAVKKNGGLDGRWDVVFFSRDLAGEVGVVGVYRDAQFIGADTEARDAAWGKLGKHVDSRKKQLEVAFGEGTPAGKQKGKHYAAERAVTWKVAEADVVVTPEFPSLPAPFSSWRDYHRFSNAYKVGEPLTEFLERLEARPDVELIAAGFETPGGSPGDVWEGRQRQRAHLARERNPAFAKKLRASRIVTNPEPAHYRCDACGATLQKEHGPYAIFGFDVHHQVPLGSAPAKGQKVRLEDLCLLCVRCHRLAHASGYHTVSALKELLKSPEGLA